MIRRSRLGCRSSKSVSNPVRDGQQLQPAQRLRHQMRLHLRPAVGRRSAGASCRRILHVHQIDHRQVDLRVIDRPMHQDSAAGRPRSLDPLRIRVVARPEQPARLQRLVIQPLRQGELQRGRDRQIADDLPDHPVLQFRFRRHAGQMPLRLLRIDGHHHQFLRDRKAAFVPVDGQPRRRLRPARSSGTCSDSARKRGRDRADIAARSPATPSGSAAPRPPARPRRAADAR